MTTDEALSLIDYAFDYPCARYDIGGNILTIVKARYLPECENSENGGITIC
ncbi:MAG: hypothetical protein ACWIPH_09105 [Ostreibacterium sp.]